MKLRTALPAVTAMLLLVAGCSEPVEPPPVTAAPTTASPTPSPTPTVDPDGITVTSDPALGIEFLEPPNLTGAEADVYDAAAMFEKAYWATITTNQLSPVFDLVAAPDLKETMGRIAASNADKGSSIGGQYVVQISDVRITGEGEASADACTDYRNSTFSNNGRVDTPEQAGKSDPEKLHYTLRANGASWQVTTSEYIGTC